MMKKAFSTKASQTISEDKIATYSYGGVDHPVYFEKGFGEGFYIKPDGAPRFSIPREDVAGIEKQIAAGKMFVPLPIMADFRNAERFALESDLNDTAAKMQENIRADRYSFAANRDGITNSKSLSDVFAGTTSERNTPATSNDLSRDLS